MTDDDQLHQLFDRAIPPPGDADGEQALTRLHYETRRREQPSHTSRHWLAVAATATAVAAVIALSVVASRGGTHRPSSPTPRPDTISTAGTWFRHSAGTVITPAGTTINLAAVWVVRLHTDGSGSFDVRPRTSFGTGMLQYDRASRQWDVTLMGKYCGTTAGRYSISRSGAALIFTAVRDECQPRRNALDGAVFAQLTDLAQLTG